MDEQAIVTDIQELNDLRMKVLNKEEIAPEKYLAVLQNVQKIRRSRGETVAKPPARKVDALALLGGIKKGGDGNG